MKTRSLVLVITATLAVEIGTLAQNAAPAAATTASSDESATIFDPTIKAIQDPNNLAILGTSGDVAVRNLIPFIQVAATAATDDKFRVNLLSQLEQNRVDKQVGPASGQNGTTNAVTRGSVPWLIGLAQEYGGMTQSTSGNTTTFKLNPINLVAALNADTNYLDSYTAGNSTFMVKYLRLLTVGFSFNTGSQSS